MDVVEGMAVLRQRCAGTDISKADAKVCVRTPGSGNRFTQTITTYGATSGEVLRLRRDLEAAQVSLVVMEARTS